MKTIGAGEYSFQDRNGIPPIRGQSKPLRVVKFYTDFSKFSIFNISRSLVFLLTVSREDQNTIFFILPICKLCNICICHLRPQHCNCFLSPAECSSKFDKKYANICIWVDICNYLNNVYRDKDFYCIFVIDYMYSVIKNY